MPGGGTAREGTLARRFKLRLSDGTVLAVDFDGLSPWLIDKRAMVQVAGTREWRPIKEVIAEARVAAKYAQKKAQEQKREHEGAPKRARGGRDALPLVPPPPKSDPPRLSAPPDDAPEDVQIGVPRGIQSLADDPLAASGPDDEPLGVLPEGAPPVRPDDRPRGQAVSRPPDESFPNAFVDTPPVAPPPADEHGFPNAFIDVPAEPPTPIPEPASEPPLPTPTAAAAPESTPPDEEALEVAPPDVVAADDEPLGALAHDPSPAPFSGDASADSPEAPVGAGFGSAFIDVPPDVPVLVDETPSEAPVVAPPDTPMPDLAPADPTPAEAAPADEPLGVLPEGDAPVLAPPAEPPAAPEPSSPVKVVVRDPVTRSAHAAPEEARAPVAESAPPDPADPLGALADEAAAPGAEKDPELPSPDESLPIIPFKGPDPDPPAPPTPPPPPAARRAIPSPETAARRTAPRAEPEDVGPVEHGALVQMLLAAAAAVGAFLSRMLSPINRLERGEPLVDEEAPPRLGPAVQDLRTKASAWAGTVGERVGGVAQRALTPRSDRASSPEDEPASRPLPLVPPPRRPKTSDDPEPSRGSVFQILLGGVQSGIAALGAFADWLAEALRPKPSTRGLPLDAELTPEDDEASLIEPHRIPVEPLAASLEEPEPPGPDDVVPVTLKKPNWRKTEPSPPAPPSPAPPALFKTEPAPPPFVPRVSATPPPSASQISTIPLAPRRPEPRDRGDMYDGADLHEGVDLGGLLQAAWAWTKVLLLLAVVGAGVAFAAVNWRTWFPRATDLGRQAFVEVDKYARSGEQKKAVEAAAAQLPHLGPETIRRVMDSRPAGVLEPGEVFRLATDAAERGMGTLSVEEAGEIDGLRGELRAQLSPSERERLREYEDTRARRMAFPVENASALKLYAKGARALPPESRERLQVLLGQAVVAGLAVPEPGAAPATSPAADAGE